MATTRAVAKPKPVHRPTLDDIQKEAIEFDHEFEGAALGRLQPTTEELRDFMAKIQTAENDDCEECRDNLREVEDLQRTVNGGHYDTATELLINVLIGAGLTGIQAQDTLEAYVALAMHEHAETWVAEHAADKK